MRLACSLAFVALLGAGVAWADEERSDLASAERPGRQASTDLTRSLEAKVTRKLDRQATVLFYDAASKMALTVGIPATRSVSGLQPVGFELQTTDDRVESAP